MVQTAEAASSRPAGSPSHVYGVCGVSVAEGRDSSDAQLLEEATPTARRINNRAETVKRGATNRYQYLSMSKMNPHRNFPRKAHALCTWWPAVSMA